MDTERFIMHFKTEDFYKDIADDIEKRFGTSNYGNECDRSLPKGKNKKVIGLMKDELGKKKHDGILCFKVKNLFLLNG